MRDELYKQLGEMEKTLGVEILPLGESTYFPSLDTLRFRRMAGEIGGLYEVPRRFLYGTRGLEEYESQDRKRVETKLAQKGEQHLRENPVVATPIELNQQLILVTLAGHDELRYSGRFGIGKIPTILIPQGDELTQMINAQSFIHGQTYESADIQPLLQREVLSALQSFARFLGSDKLPHSLGNAQTTHPQRIFPLLQNSVIS